MITTATALPDAKMFALLQEHLGLRQRRDDTVIDPRTGRYHDAQRYRDLLRAALASAAHETADDDDATSREQYKRMFHAACADLGAINEALGLDPDDGGAEPILTAIEGLKARAALASAAQPPIAEPLARYCPGCGSVGPVESNYRDCCPDGNEARMIPRALAQKCRDTFKLALDGLLTQQAQRDERLWCVNVHGPDDVHAMPSRAAALERANELNELFGRHPYEEGDPIMRAVVIEWPHSANAHKQDLADAARAAKEGGA